MGDLVDWNKPVTERDNILEMGWKSEEGNAMVGRSFSEEWRIT